MGGGDKIVLKISQKISEQFDTIFLCCPEGEAMVKRELGKKQHTKRINNVSVKKSGLILAYVLRFLSLGRTFRNALDSIDIVWSSSDFLPDTLPAAIAKIFFGKRWYGNLFLRARNPFLNEINLSVRTILYFFSQQISIFLFKNFCSGVFVLSKLDKKYLESRGVQNVIRISGGVDVSEADNVVVIEKKYDACYVGRFHYQKGLPELLIAWSKLCKKKRDLILAIVGWGIPEEVEKIKHLIVSLNLEDNVKLLGYLDGVKKYEVIKQSKLLCFPSSFESWGVVLAEAIVCGTPVVAFMIKDISDNFPEGVVWVESGNITKYAKIIKLLLENSGKRELISKKALKSRFIYDWSTQAKTLSKTISA